MALKRLVTSAATIAMLGCSSGDGTESGPMPPPFTGTVPGDTPSTPLDTQGQQPAGGTDAPSNGSSEQPPGAPGGELNPDNVGIDNPGSTDPGGGDTNGEQSGTEQPGTEEPAPVEEEPEPEPVEEEPPPIVRPALNCGAPAQPLQGAGVQSCEVNGQGTVQGQDWFLWYSGGSGCMTAYDNLAGAFTAQWNNPGDFLARIGHWFDETETFDEIGEIGADLAFTRQGSAGGFSFIGIYGWSIDPLVEYYIVEDSFGNGPAVPFATQLRGTINVDGAQYNVYSGNRQNQPSIVGNANFQQFFSVRQNPRQCGHVSISEHFRQWRNMGMNLGLAKEAKILVEAGGGNGSITFHHANVTITPPGGN